MQQLFLRKKLSVDYPYQGVKGKLGIVGKGAQGVKCLTNALPDILHDGRVKAPAHIPHGAQEGTKSRKEKENNRKTAHWDSDRSVEKKRASREKTGVRARITLEKIIYLERGLRGFFFRSFRKGRWKRAKGRV